MASAEGETPGAPGRCRVSGGWLQELGAPGGREQPHGEARRRGHGRVTQPQLVLPVLAACWAQFRDCTLYQLSSCLSGPWKVYASFYR